jgi:hypothetical protein
VCATVHLLSYFQHPTIPKVEFKVARIRLHGTVGILVHFLKEVIDRIASFSLCNISNLSQSSLIKTDLHEHSAVVELADSTLREYCE